MSTFANMRWILESDLVPSLKLLALALALHGDSDGQGIYPSVRTLGTWVGRCRRSVQRGLRDLEQLQVIQPRTKGGYGSADRNPRGGCTTVYDLRLDHLPEKGRRQCRPSSATSARKGATPASPLEHLIKGDDFNTKGRRQCRQKGDAGVARSTPDRLGSTPRERPLQRDAGRITPPPGKYVGLSKRG
jgi:Helix-turn-helix domain